MEVEHSGWVVFEVVGGVGVTEPAARGTTGDSERLSILDTKPVLSRLVVVVPLDALLLLNRFGGGGGRA